MEEGKWGQERHFELFRERGRNTSRLAFGTLFFAFVVLHKVVEPYTELAHSLADKEFELAALELELESSAIETRQLAATEEILDQAYAELARAPWMDRTEALVAELGALDDAHAQLAGADLELVHLLVDPGEIAAGTDRLSDGADLDIGRLTAQNEGDARPSIALQLPVEAPSPNNGELAIQAFQLETLHPFEDRFDALVQRFELSDVEATGAREFALRPLSAGTTAPTVFEPGEMETRNAQSLRRELEQLTRQVHTFRKLPGAMDALRLGPQQVQLTWDGDETAMQFQDLVNEQLLARAQEEADRTIRAISDDLEQRVLQPLQEVLQQPGAEARTPRVSERVERLAYELGKWTEYKLGDKHWYRSQSQKESTGADLGRALETLVDRTAEALAEDRKLVSAQQEQLNGRIAAAQAQVQEGEVERTSLALRLENLLPAWLKGLFEAPELIQLYPLGVILMILAWARNAWFLRVHARALHAFRGKQGGVIDTSLRSSLWVPLRRGNLSTTSTFLAYAAASCLLWVLFERGCTRLDEWQLLASQGEHFTPGGWTNALPWLGRAVLLGAGGCALIATLGSARQEPTPQT